MDQDLENAINVCADRIIGSGSDSIPKNMQSDLFKFLKFLIEKEPKSLLSADTVTAISNETGADEADVKKYLTKLSNRC